jgi:shikimate kinase
MTSADPMTSSPLAPPAARRDPSGPAAILVGPPGSGKTTVGSLLAKLLGVGFTDTDSLVEQEVGKPVSDIFVEDGEAAFRSVESSVVRQAVQSQRGVIAVGGGAIMNPATARLLAGQPVVYLETGFAAVARRSGIAGPHPPLPGNPRSKLRQLLEERRPRYAELAWLTVATDDLEPQDIAAQIAAALATSGPRQPGDQGDPGDQDGPGAPS